MVRDYTPDGDMTLFELHALAQKIMDDIPSSSTYELVFDQVNPMEETLSISGLRVDTEAQTIQVMV